MAVPSRWDSNSFNNARRPAELSFKFLRSVRTVALGFLDGSLDNCLDGLLISLPAFLPTFWMTVLPLE